MSILYVVSPTDLRLSANAEPLASALPSPSFYPHPGGARPVSYYQLLSLPATPTSVRSTLSPLLPVLQDGLYLLKILMFVRHETVKPSSKLRYVQAESHLVGWRMCVAAEQDTEGCWMVTPGRVSPAISSKRRAHIDLSHCSGFSGSISTGPAGAILLPAPQPLGSTRSLRARDSEL